MTPLEKAVEAGRELMLRKPEGSYEIGIEADDARAIITAFLEAAAEDDRIARAIFFRGEDMGDDAWNHCQRHLREIAKEQAQAAILALKETING